MAFDPVVAPRRLRRTPTERFRAAIYERRARTGSDELEVRLPFTMPVHCEGSPPAGMFKFNSGEPRDGHSAPS